MTEQRLSIVGIPVYGAGDDRLCGIGKLEIDDNTFVLSMDTVWIETLTNLVKAGAEIEGININVEMRAAVGMTPQIAKDIAAKKEHCNHNNISDCSAAGCPGPKQEG